MTKIFVYVVLLMVVSTAISADKNKHEKSKKKQEPTPCTCGVFLSGQFKKGSAPKESPVFTQELETYFPNNMIGQRQCTNKCIESIIKHLPKSADLICATLDRDCFKEKAYLFTKNYDSKWVNSNMSAGKEYCCKKNEPYKCPLIK